MIQLNTIMNQYQKMSINLSGLWISYNYQNEDSKEEIKDLKEDLEITSQV